MSVRAELEPRWREVRLDRLKTFAGDPVAAWLTVERRLAVEVPGPAERAHAGRDRVSRRADQHLEMSRQRDAVLRRECEQLAVAFGEAHAVHVLHSRER